MLLYWFNARLQSGFESAGWSNYSEFFFFFVTARGVRSHFPHFSCVLAVPGDFSASCKQCGRKVKLTYYKLMCIFVFAKLVSLSGQVFQLVSFICPN